MRFETLEAQARRKQLYGAWTIIGGLLIGTLLVAILAGCEGDGDRRSTPSATTGPVFCKSPVTDSPVPLALALSQAKRHNQRVLSLNDGNPSIIQTIDCGDDVVVVPPVVVVP